MTKELYVSSTPHETKVGLVEDDLLAEVYLERENEYTLAGSIYKGRVTRVLPGMQSAFVDIGLERDAFLYVSDFMELENQDDDLDEVPIARAVPDVSAQPHERASEESEDNRSQSESHARPAPAPQQAAAGRESSTTREDRDRGSYRGRRRRGRRDQPARPAPTESRPEREEYGPPPGYQPMILPGESISKYRGRGQAVTADLGAGEETHSFNEETRSGVSQSFPQDEPLFLEAADRGPELDAERSDRVSQDRLDSTAHEEETRIFADSGAREAHASSEASFAEPEIDSEEWNREQKGQHERNVAAVFGEESGEETGERVAEDRMTAVPEHADQALAAAASGTMEEEEIDEEEADFSAYVDDLEEEVAFEEFEEETHAAGEQTEIASEPSLAASAENGANIVPFSAEPVSLESAEVETAEEEVDEVAAKEAELEQAQAEAEALLDSEGRSNGTVDARAEVRAPAATAAYTQRAARPAFDRERDRSRRGFRKTGGGGRRFRRQEPQNLPQITDLLKEGQEILVQIAKEPIGKKGARITSHIALPGRFLVYMPTVNHTGVSRKIASEEERQRLKRIIQSERENGHGGFIVRTAAQGADEQELRADIRFLKGLWNEIRGRADNGKSPALIYHDLNVVERILRDQVTSDFSAIWVDTEQEYERILRFANRFQPALVRRVKLYSKETPLFEQFGLKEEIDKALKSKVWLKSGGYIVINQTEALVAIDVNTGKYVGKTARLEDTIVKTNVDAIKEIVRQIRLRDLGGIIVIDFIDMDERRNRQKVMQALEEALRSDRSPSKVLQFNDFGLVAITRKRVKQSLERTIGSPCPYCEATGFVKNVNTVCNEIYIEMRKLAKQLDHTDVMLRVNPEVAKALKTNNGRWLNELEELTKKTVIVKSDAALHQEQFDIN
ncbi:MAG: ribonuclease, Rne/Rng family [Acidobacteriaceae bacterium]|nr:ribonuclease, Rne/Rng family [Acidobacteriaceae bacterium]